MNNDKHISFGMVLHNHQPVGQSNEVFEEIYGTCYNPIVSALERHPGVKCGLHYTGSLLDWLILHRPDYIQRIRALVERGQVEVLSGGYYEPILPTIPDSDKHDQIRKLSQTVRDQFGSEPEGMWLAERVWEPTLPTHLAEAGITWTIVDDAHFKMVGLDDPDLTGYFVTEDNGNVTNVFATSKMLRYTIPWRPAQETIDCLKSEAIDEPGKILVVGDDGEKFGAWPGTYDLCWGSNGDNGWVDEFFGLLEANAEWLHTVKLTDHIHSNPSVGRVYLPTASYNEMMEWALPSAQASAYSALRSELEAKKNDAARFMKGGFWRNFLVKYPEANTQHKKMLRVHDLIKQAWPHTNTTKHGAQYSALSDLWSGQSNDTYWHGLFGGVYLNDLRVRVQGHLIRAQQEAERAIYGEQNWLKPDITDFDRDSLYELLLEGNALNLYIDLADGGSIFEWDLRPHNYNLASTVARREEPYHAKIRAAEESRRAASKKRTSRSKSAKTESAAAPGAEIQLKEEGLDALLHYDTYRRGCMIDHFLGPGTTLENFRDNSYNEEGDFVNSPYSAEMDDNGVVLSTILLRDGHINTATGSRPVRVSKRLTLKPGSPDFRVLYTIQNTGDDELTGVFASEWNINLLGGGHNPTAYYRVEDVELDNALLDSTGEVKNVSELALGNSWLEIEMGLRVNHPATFWRYPIETVSGSESGFERTYQGSCVLLQWLLKLPAGDSIDIELQWRNQGSTQHMHEDWLD